MLASMLRFVCCNGLIAGQVVDDIRIPHKGNIQGEVIDGAFRVLDDRKLALSIQAFSADMGQRPLHEPTRMPAQNPAPTHAGPTR